MSRVFLTDAKVVTPDRVIDGGTVVIVDGVIAEVCDRAFPLGPDTRSLGGRYLLPGFVDLHNDTLDREVTLRDASTAIDPDYAMAQYDRRLAAAGVTTEFHGISFIEHPRDPWRDLAFATRAATAVRALRRAPYATIEHRILYRLELRSPGAFDTLLAALDCDDTPQPLVAVAHHNIKDQRPLRLESFLSCLSHERALARADENGATDETTIINALNRVLTLAEERGLLLASHDDDVPERVDMEADLGFRIAEFPMTVAAATRAKERGMAVEVGAPNVLRGRSYQGAVSGRTLIGHGVADILTADYHAPTLLGAVFRIAIERLASLPTAVAMATANPARAVNLTDRGAIAPEQRADLAVASLHGEIPVIDATFVRGQPVYQGSSLI